jgi:group I intron endonuclease
MKEKVYYVYITTNLVNGKQYVGDRTCLYDPLNDNYLGSGTYFKNAIKKYGKENFVKEILEFFPTKQEAFNAQEKYIKQYNTLAPNGYNISPKGGYGIPSSYLHEETKNKISLSQKGKKHSKQQNENHSRKMKGSNNPNWKGKAQQSPETRKKLKHPKSEEQKKKLQIIMTGKTHSKETKQKISNTLTGKKHSEETKTKMKHSHKKMSEESRKNISLAHIGVFTEKQRKAINNIKKCKFCGKETNLINHNRWHGNRCKLRNISQ